MDRWNSLVRYLSFDRWVEIKKKLQYSSGGLVVAWRNKRICCFDLLYSLPVCFRSLCRINLVRFLFLLGKLTSVCNKPCYLFKIAWHISVNCKVTITSLTMIRWGWLTVVKLTGWDSWKWLPSLLSADRWCQRSSCCGNFGNGYTAVNLFFSSIFGWWVFWYGAVYKICTGECFWWNEFVTNNHCIPACVHVLSILLVLGKYMHA